MKAIDNPVLMEHDRESENVTGLQVKDALLWSTSEGMAYLLVANSEINTDSQL